MSHSIHFRIDGVPLPQGSKKGYIRGVKNGKWICYNPKIHRVMIVDVNDKALKRWRDCVAKVASLYKPSEPWDSPISFKATFYLPRPKFHFRNGRYGQRILRNDAPKYVGVYPDGDKLDRAVWDALTGIVWADDSRCVMWRGVKLYGENLYNEERRRWEPIPGVAITVAPILENCLGGEEELFGGVT